MQSVHSQALQKLTTDKGIIITSDLEPWTRKVSLTVPRVNKLLLIYDPSFLRRPVVSVFELSEPARSIKFCKFNKCLILDQYSTYQAAHQRYRSQSRHSGQSQKFRASSFSLKTEVIRLRAYKLGECDIIVRVALTSWATFYSLRTQQSSDNFSIISGCVVFTPNC